MRKACVRRFTNMVDTETARIQRVSRPPLKGPASHNLFWIYSALNPHYVSGKNAAHA